MSDGPRLPDGVRSMPEALAFWAETAPEAPAIVVPGRPVTTYANLWRRVGALAAFLADAGLGRQDRVVLLLLIGAAPGRPAGRPGRPRG